MDNWLKDLLGHNIQALQIVKSPLGLLVLAILIPGAPDFAVILRSESDIVRLAGFVLYLVYAAGLSGLVGYLIRHGHGAHLVFSAQDYPHESLGTSARVLTLDQLQELTPVKPPPELASPIAPVEEES